MNRATFAHLRQFVCGADVHSERLQRRLRRPECLLALWCIVFLQTSNSVCLPLNMNPHNPLRFNRSVLLMMEENISL